MSDRWIKILWLKLHFKSWSMYKYIKLRKYWGSNKRPIKWHNKAKISLLFHSVTHCCIYFNIRIHGLKNRPKTNLLDTGSYIIHKVQNWEWEVLNNQVTDWLTFYKSQRSILVSTNHKQTPLQFKTFLISDSRLRWLLPKRSSNQTMYTRFLHPTSSGSSFHPYLKCINNKWTVLVTFFPFFSHFTSHKVQALSSTLCSQV